MNHINIGFSIHRPEMVAKTAELMGWHDAIFLEEPPAPDFKKMLTGALSVADYLMPLDAEYPAFSRQMCELEIQLHAAGKQLIQVTEDAGLRQHLYSPGDQLTMFYIFHPRKADIEQEKLLAARSIVYSKIIHKEENTGKDKAFFHLKDEIACIRMVKKLSISNCRRLYGLIRQAMTIDARRIVEFFLEMPAFQDEK